MGSIHEFCAEYKISLAKARRMDKRGWLRIDTKTTPVDAIRLWLKQGQKLTVAQMVELIERPAGIIELGPYAGKVEDQISALGDVRGQAAPREVAANILEAYQNRTDAVELIAAWLASVIPSHPVGHAYLATRLLLGVPADIRKDDIPHLQRVMMYCRAHPAMMGLSSTVFEKSRNVTLYQKKALDL